jgi:hypothetical protein
MAKKTIPNISVLTDKATPLDADITIIESAVDSNAKRKLTWANIKATLKTYFDGLHVTAPDLNTDGYIPQWDGANSKLLKNGLAVPAGGLAGLTALGDKVDKVTGSRLITSAESTIIGNTSNTNSGDNATNTQYSGLVTFPGFGTSHSTAAYGDHNHSGVYAPALGADDNYVTDAQLAALHPAATVTTTNGLSISGQEISLQLASTSTHGALSDTDWNTFNNKQATLTNPITGTGTTNELSYWASASTQGTLPVATYPSLTELSYVKGVTSGIQSQINAKGVGTVTAVSVATANGVSGSSSGGATPALTIALGAITPTSVNGTLVGQGTNNIAGNTRIGNNSLVSATLSGDSNTAVGINILQLNTTGRFNVGIGSNNISYNSTGNNNTAVGAYALLGATSTNISGNVALGFFAGRYTAGSNEFYVDNQDRTDTAGDKAKALMYGVFAATAAAQTLKINAVVTTDGTITAPTFIGALTGTASGNLTSASTLDATKISGAIPSAVTATTQSANNNSTKIATTAYVDAKPAGGNWVAVTGTRTANTTFTVAGDQTAIFKKGLIVMWTDTTPHVGMVSIPSTYSSVTTVTIIGDECGASASAFKYSLIGAEPFIKEFAVAGNIGAVATDVSRAYYATEPMRVLGADLQVGTAGTTNSTTVDINLGGTTMFTTKPTLASTVVTSATPFTADDNKSLALADRVSIDIDAIQTTAAIDLYVQLYLFPVRYLSLV